MKRIMALVATFAAGLSFGCGSNEPAGESGGGAKAKGKKDKRFSVAYVTNGVDPFWTIAEAGALAGGKEYGVDIEVLMPPKGIVDQKRMVEGLLTRGVDGIAISPIDAANQVEFINEACKQTIVITQDSDAPQSDRICFIGMDNYKAGRQCGKLVKEAMPDGGSVMIFVGRLEQLNAQQRRQGVIDELLDRPMQNLDTLTFDPPDAAPPGDLYSILGTRTDNFDYAKAKSNAEDAMATYPDLGCMVGLFAYNMPACIAAVEEAGKLHKIKLASFDEADGTLQGIMDGYVQGTVSQQPYVYGKESVRVLAALAGGDRSVVPENGFIEIETVLVRKDNVKEFWDELKRLKGGK
jgi:ribose transport system substrate-binding protein